MGNYEGDEKRDVTISKAEYEDLLDTNARVSILVGELSRIWQETVDDAAKYDFICRVKNSEISTELVANIIGCTPRMRGYIKQEEEVREMNVKE